ncbi:MAG: hypothetical protein KDC87_02255 [Planctomycetes bacterium]|nr:hypothetical protein [Planctomycetota bacterium]
MLESARRHGRGYRGTPVVDWIAAAVKILFAVLRMATIGTATSPPVVRGMLAAIGVTTTPKTVLGSAAANKVTWPPSITPS